MPSCSRDPSSSLSHIISQFGFRSICNEAKRACQPQYCLLRFHLDRYLVFTLNRNKQNLSVSIFKFHIPKLFLVYIYYIHLFCLKVSMQLRPQYYLSVFGGWSPLKKLSHKSSIGWATPPYHPPCRHRPAFAHGSAFFLLRPLRLNLNLVHPGGSNCSYDDDDDRGWSPGWMAFLYGWGGGYPFISHECHHNYLSLYFASTRSSATIRNSNSVAFYRLCHQHRHHLHRHPASQPPSPWYAIIRFPGCCKFEKMGMHYSTIISHHPPQCASSLAPFKACT